MKSAIVVAAALAASTAHAGELADAFARSDVKTLRARRADAAARCTLGAVYAKKQDLPRAHLYLLGCDEAELPDDVAASVAKAAREVAKKVRASELSSIVIAVEPEGTTLVAEISALPGDTFTAPATIWVAAGSYELTARDAERVWKQPVRVGEFSRTSTVIDTTTARKQRVEPRAGQVNFDEGGELEHESGPPPPVKRGSLMSKKYLGVVDPAAAGEPLEDPLAYRAARYPTRPLWLGLRLGGGMFDDGASAARAGAAVAATVRYRLTPRAFAAGRVDWSRRTGASIDTLGASAGAGATILDARSATVAVLAQLRADLRLTDAMDVRTLGASGALGLEVALPATPITAGLRFEPGLTAVAGDTRDRAVLLEIGVDWR